MKKRAGLFSNISNRVLYSLITLFVFAIIGVGVYAVTAPIPVGHGSEQVNVDIGGTVKTLQEAIDAGDFGGSGGEGLDTAGTIRSTSQTAPLIGAGLEVIYHAGEGYLSSIDRSSGDLKPLNLYGSDIKFCNSAGCTSNTGGGAWSSFSREVICTNTGSSTSCTGTGASGNTWTVPNGVNVVRILAVGGGGGGGSGAFGGSASDMGSEGSGTGGGGGGIVYQTFFINSGDQLKISVGAGGAGGFSSDGTIYNVYPGRAGGDTSVFNSMDGIDIKIIATGGKGGSNGACTPGEGGIAYIHSSSYPSSIINSGGRGTNDINGPCSSGLAQNGINAIGIGGSAGNAGMFADRTNSKGGGGGGGSYGTGGNGATHTLIYSGGTPYLQDRILATSGSANGGGGGGGGFEDDNYDYYSFKAGAAGASGVVKIYY
ncbi:hypothetical protein HY449_03615 [Candidatus Pacearchaeota archaeon]|nr:hypothetical protein [Candidatus Pacearchaeota archaeon]